VAAAAMMMMMIIISLKARRRQQKLKGTVGQMKKFVILEAVRSHIINFP
jgi:hypothetical protein